MSNNSFKVAVVSNNGSTASRHFGPAPFYEVFTVENGQVTSRDRREKFNAHAPGMHRQHNHQTDEDAGSIPNQALNTFAAAQVGNGHGMGHRAGHDSGHRHIAVISNITDCECLISRGMGYGIYNHLESANIRPIITDIQMIGDGVKAVIDGTIVNHSGKLH